MNIKILKYARAQQRNCSSSSWGTMLIFPLCHCSQHFYKLITIIYAVATKATLNKFSRTLYIPNQNNNNKNSSKHKLHSSPYSTALTNRAISIGQSYEFSCKFNQSPTSVRLKCSVLHGFGVNLCMQHALAKSVHLEEPSY